MWGLLIENRIFYISFFSPRNGLLRPREYLYFSFLIFAFLFSQYLLVTSACLYIFLSTTRYPSVFLYFLSFNIFPYCSLSKQFLSVIFNFSVSSLICFTYSSTSLYSRILSKTLLFSFPGPFLPWGPFLILILFSRYFIPV